MNPRRGDRLGDAERRYQMALRRCRTLTAARVLTYLHRLEQKHRQVTPARAQIAQGIGRCERSVTRAVAELETIGAVAVWRDPPHKRQDGTFARARTNLYRMKWPRRGRVVPGRTDGTRESRLCTFGSNRSHWVGRRTAGDPVRRRRAGAGS